MLALIQARGALIAFRSDEGPAIAASANAAAMLGAEVMGAIPQALLGGDALHAARNALSLPWAAREPVFAGHHRVGARELDISVHRRDGRMIVEVEPSPRAAVPDGYEVVRDVRALAERISEDGGTQGLPDLVRTLSGFDYVALGEVPEEVSGVLVLDDVRRAPVPVDGDVPDISLAGLRQPSKATLDRLADEGIRALAVFGPIVLSHPEPRVPSHRTRLVLTHVSRLLEK